MGIFSVNMPIYDVLEKGLDNLDLRGKLLQHNLANIDTPNFKRSDLNFDQALQSALGQANSSSLDLTRSMDAHLPGLENKRYSLIMTDETTSKRNDNNNVDIDMETTRLAQNTLSYMYLTRSLTTQMNILRQAYQT